MIQLVSFKTSKKNLQNDRNRGESVCEQIERLEIDINVLRKTFSQKRDRENDNVIGTKWYTEDIFEYCLAEVTNDAAEARQIEKFDYVWQIID